MTAESLVASRFPGPGVRFARESQVRRNGLARLAISGAMPRHEMVRLTSRGDIGATSFAQAPHRMVKFNLNSLPT